jgi:Na+-transporting NADH:ubiquinone oxidoreductase subunit C
MSDNKETLKNIIGVALGVCLVCAILVSSAAVALKPIQDANQRLEKRKNVLMAGGLMEEGVDIEKVFAEKIEPLIIDLKTGDPLPKEKLTGNLDPEKFDLKRIHKDAETSAVFEDVKKDKAKIKRMPKYSLLYLVKEGNDVQQVIFPVYGLGLWSTMYGFIAVDKDMKTVKGFTIYEHGETPGLGGEVDNPNWKGLWKGKLIFNDSGKFILEVIKGLAGPGSKTKIDGLSGATITTFGVRDMIHFWFSADGFGPYIEKFRKEGV